MRMKLLLPCAFIGGLLFHAASLRAADQPNDRTPWKITGQLEEACSCDAACPCWFNSKPTKMTCGGGQVLFIEKGNYGDVKLDGLALATMGQSPEGKTMMESVRHLELCLLLHRREGQPGPAQSIGSHRRRCVDTGCVEENADTLCTNHSQNRGQRTSNHDWAIWHVPWASCRRRHGWCAENCKPAGRGSAASPIRTRTHDEDDL